MGAGLTCFWPGVPVVAMAQETGIEPKPVWPALNYLRLAFQTDYPIFFPATVEIAQIYLGRQWEKQETPPKSWCNQT